MKQSTKQSMKLHLTRRSPFGRKVYVVALEKGLGNAIEIIWEDLGKKSETLLLANPMGTVPTLTLSDGESYFDSPVIAEYFDSLVKKPRLIPKKKEKRFRVLRIAALADAMMENAVAVYYQNILEPQKRDQAKLDKHLANLQRSFAMLEHDIKIFQKKVNLAAIATAAALGYINFRIPELVWQVQQPKLSGWFDRFSERPSMEKTVPVA